MDLPFTIMGERLWNGQVLEERQEFCLICLFRHPNGDVKYDVGYISEIKKLNGPKMQIIYKVMS